MTSLHFFAATRLAARPSPSNPGMPVTPVCVYVLKMQDSDHGGGCGAVLRAAKLTDSEVLFGYETVLILFHS
jgi:hypothetical protein